MFYQRTANNCIKRQTLMQGLAFGSKRKDYLIGKKEEGNGNPESKTTKQGGNEEK
jgi:hypothetical protein